MAGSYELVFELFFASTIRDVPSGLFASVGHAWKSADDMLYLRRRTHDLYELSVSACESAGVIHSFIDDTWYTHTHMDQGSVMSDENRQ